jgi:glycosyltransferase involved in cell wall biosynthesis
MSGPLVSVLINNYNYGRFLPAAIESVLAQNYRPVEIVVVDDGSTDESREIICRYKDRIIPVFQQNKGQASAFNVGVARSRGTILCFLDSDDFFYQDKIERVVRLFRENGSNLQPLMVHHRLELKNEFGEDLDGQLIGRTHKSPLNVYDYAKRYHYFYYAAGPTTGLSLNRALTERLFPIPEQGVRVSADDLLVRGASLIGLLYSMEEVLGGYRVHGNNNWYTARRIKSNEFKEIEREYLNRKLVENGLLPVISFQDSMHAWDELMEARRWPNLAYQMIRLSLRQRDRYTAWFVQKTIKAALVRELDALRQKFSGTQTNSSKCQ